jgi:hypothetical protein
MEETTATRIEDDITKLNLSTNSDNNFSDLPASMSNLSKLDISAAGEGSNPVDEEKFHDCQDEILANAEHDDLGNEEEDDEFSEANEILVDDFVDEDYLKEQETLLSEEQLKVSCSVISKKPYFIS